MGMRSPYKARASARPWAASANIAFDVSFLKAHPPMVAPEIAWLLLRFTGSGTGTMGDKLPIANIIRTVFSRLFATDARGDCINAAGTTLRQWAQRTLGAGYTEADDITVTGMAQTVTVDLMIPFERRKGQDPSDTRKPVSDLAGQGGQIKILTGPADIATDGMAFTLSSGDIEVWAGITDYGQKRVTSRLQLRDYVIGNIDFRYSVEGLLCDLWVSEQQSDIETPTTMSDQSYISDGLQYASYPSDVLNDIYESEQFSLAPSDDVVAGFAQNVFNSSNYQSSAELPDLQEVQVRFSTTPPTNGQVCIASITARSGDAAAAALGVPTAALPALVGSTEVIGKSGKDSSYAGTKLSTFLPATVAKTTLNKAA